MKLIFKYKLHSILILAVITLVTFVSIKHYKNEKQLKYKQAISLKIYQDTIKTIENYDLKSIKIEHFDKLDNLDKNILEVGKKEISNHKIIIVGITRDNLEDLLVTMKHINYIGNQFKDYRVILFENDSKDGTKIALDLWAQKDPKVKIISENFNLQKRPSHKFMADIRNKYLYAIKDKEYNDFDIVMAIDMDMSYGVDIRGIQDSFSKIDQWDAICSNGLTRGSKMFDMFAFRNAEFPFTPLKWHEVCSSNDETNPWLEKCKNGNKYVQGITYKYMGFRGGWQENSRLYWMLIVPQGQKIYPIGSNLVPVNSCFGGMAFYKKNIINSCEYNSIDNDCEHVPFHECLKDKNNGRIFMNPSQVIRYSHYK